MPMRLCNKLQVKKGGHKIFVCIDNGGIVYYLTDNKIEGSLQAPQITCLHTIFCVHSP